MIFNNLADEVMRSLLPTPIVAITTMISLALLTFVFTKFAYKPIVKNLESRKKYVQDHIDEAEKQNSKASLNFEESVSRLTSAKNESTKMIEHASDEGNKKAIDIVTKAKEKSDDMIEQAHRIIKLESQQAKEQIRDDIIDVAFAATKKIIDKEIDEKINKKIINEFIDSI